MYDDYPAFDIPQRNIVQRFFAQKWSAIALEIVLTLVITVAAGGAFDFFGPFDAGEERAEPAASGAATIALEPVTRRGQAYAQSRNFAAAKAMYDLAIAVAPGEASFHNWRGFVNLQSGDYLAAQDDFRQTLELEGGDYEAHVSLCWAYGESGDFASAREHCQAALGLAQSLPQYAVALENRCWLGVEMGDFTSAAADCNAVLEALPDCQTSVCALANYNLGRIAWFLGRVERALSRFRLALAIGSQYPLMYLEIAKVYDTLGFEAAARMSYDVYRSLGTGGA